MLQQADELRKHIEYSMTRYEDLQQRYHELERAKQQLQQQYEKRGQQHERIEKIMSSATTIFTQHQQHCQLLFEENQRLRQQLEDRKVSTPGSTLLGDRNTDVEQAVSGQVSTTQGDYGWLEDWERILAAA